MTSAPPSSLGMIVIDARVFSSKHVMIGDSKTSDYAYMLSIIWNVEGIPIYCFFATDIGALLERYFISCYTRGKGGVVPNNIPLSRWLGVQWRSKEDAINIESWPDPYVPKSFYQWIGETPLYESFPSSHIDKSPQIPRWIQYRAKLIEL